ncbi:hypothetical protein [uncultured Duncaniella sp.]|uniref:hypothetical protein n=1 Tax=uncultured Duncaniella sp. TaxID=2768039 RepID=UPI00272D0C18|nr:hypothetical protein [uncultured Duncaniella sp.]
MDCRRQPLMLPQIPQTFPDSPTARESLPLSGVPTVTQSYSIIPQDQGPQPSDIKELHGNLRSAAVFL